MPPLTGDRRFRNQPIRIADLTVTTAVIQNYEFSNCRIIGPAILGIVNDVTITGCSFDAPSLEAVFWEVPPERGGVLGVVGVMECIFSGCTFEMIGIAGPPEMRALLANGLQFE